MPPLRYRTGDWASLDTADPSQLVLIGLEGRKPVVFRGGDGRSINNIDVTGALKLLALTEYSLHKFVDGGLRLRVPGSMTETSAARDALLAQLAQAFVSRLRRLVQGKRVQARAAHQRPRSALALSSRQPLAVPLALMLFGAIFLRCIDTVFTRIGR